MVTWAACERLLPQVLAVAEHAERLGVAGEEAGWLLYRASSYLRERGLYHQARPVAEQALAFTVAALAQRMSRWRGATTRWVGCCAV